jgi:hypothetical protein
MTLPLHVTIEEIDAQRAAGWPDFHPEDFCHRCGGKNPTWFIDSDRFNMAMGPTERHLWNGIICPGCFVDLHEAATGMHTVWTLTPWPQTPFRWIEDSTTIDDGSPA